MPLFTTNIDEARVAYATLELRASSAEAHASLLTDRIAALEASHAETIAQRRAISDSYLGVVAANLTLHDQVAAQPPDILLSAYVAHLGTAAAIAEAVTPDRAIPTLAATVQAWATFRGGDVGLTFGRPQDRSSTFSSTTLELAKVPVDGSAAPRMITVLQTKLAIYGSAPFAALAAAQTLIVAASGGVSAAGTWTFASLAALAVRIATLEETLAAGLDRAHTPELAAAFTSAATAAVTTATGISQHAVPVSADVAALALALQRTNAAAAQLLA